MCDFLDSFKRTSKLYRAQEENELQIVDDITSEEDIEVTKQNIKLEFMDISNNIGVIDKLRFNMSYGTNSKEIYLQCCKDLNFNKYLASEFGMNQICYAKKVIDEYSAWFLPYSNLAKIKKTPGGRWENYIRAPYIWETYNFGVIPMTKGDKRITFVKVNDNNKEKYVFIGVYQSYQEFRNKEGKLVLKYKRISKEYPKNL